MQSNSSQQEQYINQIWLNSTHPITRNHALHEKYTHNSTLNADMTPLIKAISHDDNTTPKINSVSLATVKPHHNKQW
jgi:hypothetical protein